MSENNTIEIKNLKKNTLIDKFLNRIERLGNALPHPATLFLIFALAVIVISWIVANFDVSVIHPGTKAIVKPFNLISKEGLHKILTEMVVNFTSFAPLGTVLVAMLGIGIAESSGLFSTLIKLIVNSSPKKLITFVIVFAGVMSNMASEVGYVLLVPLGGIIFMGFGRHPIAGLAAAFAGVSGGYSANLLLGTIDPLLSGLSTEAAQIIDINYIVNPAANYYFMFVSTFFIAAAGTIVTEKIVEPRLGKYVDENNSTNTITKEEQNMKTLDKREIKGLIYSLVSLLFIVAIILLGTVPQYGFLRDPKTFELLHSPFMSGIVAIIFLSSAIAGIFYGIGAGTFKSDADVMKGMGKSIEALGGYIVLVFFAAQFVAFFKWTNLGLIFAIKGASVLQATGLGIVPLLILFIILSAFINLIMGSASAKWAIMAPVFIPMFMILGYSPELIQCAYRVGDSVTNVISPMMSYFALIVAFLSKYDKKAGIGTVIATMLPYSFVFFIIWTILFLIWFGLGLPLGPDSPLYIPIK